MPFMLMEPTNQTFRELIGNGIRYKVPRFQRDYAWTQEQWEDLWSDIESMDEGEYHYMGYIVLQRKGQHDFEVIDGQQRLITLSLVVLAAIRALRDLVDAGRDGEENSERVKVLTSQFVGAKNPVSLRIDNKLSLNRNNRVHFRSMCDSLAVANRRGIKVTNRLLNRAFAFFSAKDMGTTGQGLAEFVERVASGMIFTKIVVHDDLNAYKVFETLNARGVQLSTPDLLKNYIFSTIARPDNITDEELDDIDEQWSEILSLLGERDFTAFVRYHHNFQARMVTKKNLFSAIRSLASTPESAYAYLRSLTEFASIYAALLNEHDEWWVHQDDEYRRAKPALSGLNLFNIKQPLTILMAAFSKFSSREFVKLVGYIYVLSVRYNLVCQLSPNEQEHAYNQLAMGIHSGALHRASAVKNHSAFCALYPDDKTFKNAFEVHRMPSRQSSKQIRFLLAEIEAHLGHRTEYTKTVLEHVCPYNPNDEWNSTFGDGAADVQDRLGNMVLLGNDPLKRASFQEKRQHYNETPHPLANKVGSYESWDQRQMQEYQTWLAEQATETWSIAYE